MSQPYWVPIVKVYNYNILLSKRDADVQSFEDFFNFCLPSKSPSYANCWTTSEMVISSTK